MTEFTAKSTAKFTWTCGGNIHRFLLQSAVCKELFLGQKLKGRFTGDSFRKASSYRCPWGSGLGLGSGVVGGCFPVEN